MYKQDIGNIVNEGKIGRSTHQNQWIFPSNNTNDGVANDFSLNGKFGKIILSKDQRIINVALKYHTQKTEMNLFLT